MSQADTRPHGKSDADLVAESRAGRSEAFGELVTRYQDRVFNLAFRLTSSRDAAAEVAQDAFLKAYRGLNSFREDSAFYTWLFRITVNTVRSRQRFAAVRPTPMSLDATHGSRPESGGRNRQHLAAELESRGPDPSEEASRAERRQLVEGALTRLHEDQRILIVLRDIEGRNYQEIADLLDYPRGTVKSKLHRARMALKDLLAPAMSDEW